MQKKISLFGYGKTIKAIAKKIGQSKIYDDSFKDVKRDEYGNKLLPSNLFNPNKSDLEIVTPAIPPHNELILKSKNIISDYDYFSDDFPFSIWISGTNGKTTVTEMITHLLKSRGAICGGNIGIPIAEMDKKAPIWIIETSSFTLHYTNIAKPNIYILLPITEDHLSWHKTFKEYENAKLKPLSFMEEGEAIILPDKYKNIKSDGFKITYKNSQELAKYFDIDILKINFKEPFLFNAILSLGVSKILFDKIDYDLINSFKVGKHKLEEFIDKNNRLWVDDSKATNIDATIKGLQSYKNKKIYLILGGDDKGVDLTPLIKNLKSYNLTIFSIGKSAKLIKNLSNKFDIKCKVVNKLKIAVKKISKIHNKNSVAILSPACASKDQFKNYIERGESFIKFINKI